MVSVTKCIRIHAPVGEVYRFWEHFENFPSFIHSVESVGKLDENRSRWVIRAPFGMRVQFDAVTTDKRENERIAWRSEHGHGRWTDSVKSEGELRFHEAEQGQATDVHLKFSYELPGSVAEKMAEMLSKVGYPGREFDTGLKEIKECIETKCVA